MNMDVQPQGSRTFTVVATDQTNRVTTAREAQSDVTAEVPILT